MTGRIGSQEAGKPSVRAVTKDAPTKGREPVIDLTNACVCGCGVFMPEGRVHAKNCFGVCCDPRRMSRMDETKNPESRIKRRARA